MNDEYAEVKQRAAMHWARLQASMLIDEVSVRDRILQSKLYVTRWFLYVFTSDSDDEVDYIDGTCHDYESTLRHHSSFSGGFRRSSSSMSLGGVPRRQNRIIDLNNTQHHHHRVVCKVTQRCCCCRRSILRYLHRSQRIILSKFAHRKNLSICEVETERGLCSSVRICSLTLSKL